MRTFFLFLSTLFLISCGNKMQADLLIINAEVYTVNENFDTAEAFVVKNGKIVEVGTTSSLQSRYEAAETYDFAGKTILPVLLMHTLIFTGWASIKK